MPSAIDIERRAKPFARPLTRYQAEIPATKKLAEISTAASMCGQRQRKDGLKMTRIQSVGSNWPWTTLYPAGVCIHEFAAMIHVDDRTVPIDTITVDRNIVPLRTRPSP